MVDKQIICPKCHEIIDHEIIRQTNDVTDYDRVYQLGRMDAIDEIIGMLTSMSSEDQKTD